MLLIRDASKGGDSHSSPRVYGRPANGVKLPWPGRVSCASFECCGLPPERGALRRATQSAAPCGARHGGSVPLIDEHVRAVGADVRELARLHAALARSEARHGVVRIAAAILLCGFAVAAAVAVLVAAGVAGFLFLQRFVSPASAAAVVAATYLVLVGAASWIGWRLLRGARSLSLPQTRAMLWE